jgi:hypothetical protein
MIPIVRSGPVLASSQVSASSKPAWSGPACASCGAVRPPRLGARCCDGNGRQSRSTRRWRPSTQPELPAPESWPEGSLARTSVTLDNVSALRASVRDYGLTSPVSFASFDPITSSWRTSQVCLLEEWAKFSETWPQAGSMRSGTCYRLPPSAPRTYERASGFWPTPVASERKRMSPYSRGGHSLMFALGGRPSPEFLDWMMGFHPGSVRQWATLWSAKSPSTSDGG